MCVQARHLLLVETFAFCYVYVTSRKEWEKGRENNSTQDEWVHDKCGFLCCNISRTSNRLGCTQLWIGTSFLFLRILLTHKLNQTKPFHICKCLLFPTRTYTHAHFSSFFLFKSFRRAIPLQRIKCFTIALSFFQQCLKLKCLPLRVRMNFFFLACFKYNRGKQKHTYDTPGIHIVIESYRHSSNVKRIISF